MEILSLKQSTTCSKRLLYVYLQKTLLTNKNGLNALAIARALDSAEGIKIYPGLWFRRRYELARRTLSLVHVGKIHWRSGGFPF